MKAAEYNQQIILKWGERVLQDHVVRLAKSLGWMAYHVYDSRRSEPGYPDLHLVHPEGRRSLFRELKTTKGKTTAAQDRWLAALASANQDAGIWRPEDWASGRIERELKGGR